MSAPHSTPAVVGRPSSPSEGKLPSLDGWRALSILLVLANHASITRGFPETWREPVHQVLDGALGVRVFFVISGFLITWLLLQEKSRTGTVSLRDFYIRRALRILPIYGAFLLAVGIIQAVGAYSQPRAMWIANLTFTTNYVEDGGWLTGHLWSLGVEEQFYLLWPALLVFGGLLEDRRRALLVFAGVLALAAVWRVCSTVHAIPGPLHVLFAPFSFFNHFDALASGCLGAFLFARWDGLRHWCTHRPVLSATLALAAIAVPQALFQRLIASPVIVPFGPTCMNAGITFLVLQSLHLPRSGYGFLNLRAVAFLGMLSYSLYIWQEMFCAPDGFFGSAPLGLTAFPGCLIATFAVALVSYYGLERPLLRLRSRFRHLSLR